MFAPRDKCHFVSSSAEVSTANKSGLLPSLLRHGAKKGNFVGLPVAQR